MSSPRTKDKDKEGIDRLIKDKPATPAEEREEERETVREKSRPSSF
jgi:hypothetical protein